MATEDVYVVTRVASRPRRAAFVAAVNGTSHDAQPVTPSKDSMAPDAVTLAAQDVGPVTIVGAPPELAPGRVAESWSDVPIPQAGLLAVIGTAGTGKSTALRLLAEHVRASRPTHGILYMEPDAQSSKVLTSDSDFAQQLAHLLATAAAETPTGAVVIDSLRAWVTLGTGYDSRLGSGGWDLTMFPALTQLDLAAKQLGVLVIAAIYVEAMQLGASDPGNEAKMSATLQLLLRSMDGSTSTALLMGPTTRERGHFLVLTRLDDANGQSLRQANPQPGQFHLTDAGPAVAPMEIDAFTRTTACWDLAGHGAAWAQQVVKTRAHVDDHAPVTPAEAEKAQKLLEISSAVRSF